jgi:hypothetical protein
MASTLNRTGESRPEIRGHTTRDLGPSDTSDSGSDVVGGPGLIDVEPLDLDRGTTEDPDLSPAGGGAGADIGDADLDSDSDAQGTGENITAGRDPAYTDRDVMPDRIIDDLSELGGGDDEGDGDSANAVRGAQYPDRLIDDLTDAGDDEDTEVSEQPAAAAPEAPSAAPAQAPGEPPSIDNPPPIQSKDDVPIADRVEDAPAPENGVRRNSI